MKFNKTRKIIKKKNEFADEKIFHLYVKMRKYADGIDEILGSEKNGKWFFRNWYRTCKWESRNLKYILSQMIKHYKEKRAIYKKLGFI